MKRRPNAGVVMLDLVAELAGLERHRDVNLCLLVKEYMYACTLTRYNCNITKYSDT